MQDTIRAVERGLDALTHLRRVGCDSPSRIATAIGLSRPTTYRILYTLENAKLIERDPCDGRISLSRRAGKLGEGVTLQDKAVWAALPTLEELQKRVVWTSHVATLGIDSMCVRECTHSLNPFAIVVSKATRLKRSLLQSALGRAYIGFCPEPERNALIERLAMTEAKDYPPDYISSIIEQTNRDGFASMPFSSEVREGAIALPIRSGGRVAACLDVGWISSAVRFDEAVRKFLPHLQWAQADIEQRLAELLAGMPAEPLARSQVS